MNIIAQIIGGIAVLFFASSIQLKEHKRLLIFQLIGNFFYSIQYFCLNAVGAGFMNLTSVARCLLLYNYDTKKKKKPWYTLVLFVIIIGIIGVFTIKNPLDFIPILIALGYTLSTYQDNRLIISITFLVAACLWVFYNIKVGAYASLLGNVLEFSSGVVATYRYIKNKK